MTTPSRLRRRLLGSLLALPALAGARTPRSTPPLQLAIDAAPDVDPAGYLVSEKYDGVRALWDGQQLRFRSGLPIAAPDWFTQALPTTALDGELWLGRGRFEALSAAVRRHRAEDAEWRALRYMVFELPVSGGDFAARAARIATLAALQPDGPWRAAPQRRVADRAALQRELDAVVRGGGEGLVLHRADAPVRAGRSDALLKLKPLQDAEARVLAHLPGHGRHAGRLGALRVRTDDGTVFSIGTGFSDAQRDDPPAIGAEITFTYRGRTDAGVPRFASFLRLRSL